MEQRFRSTPLLLKIFSIYLMGTLLPVFTFPGVSSAIEFKSSGDSDLEEAPDQEQNDTEEDASGLDEEIDWEVYVDLEGNIFPSFLIASATLKMDEEAEISEEESRIGDATGLIGALLSNVPADSEVRLEVKTNSILKTSVLEELTEQDYEELLGTPKVNYDFDALVRTRQQMPINIEVELRVDGESYGTKTKTVVLRSINDALFGFEDEQGDDIDLGWVFASYVNENHPWVSTLLKEALEAGVVKAFDGYQSESEEEVIAQVFAIWNVLQRRELKYSDISTTSSESDTIYSQYVRLLEESVDQKQANCVDGSVVFASTLRKIGINAHLVLVPGHMFFAFDLDPQGERILGLETTMMGDASLKAVALKEAKLSAARQEELKNFTSWNSFSEAIDAGTQALKESAAAFQDEENLEYQIISIAAARALGVMPIAYRAAGE